MISLLRLIQIIFRPSGNHFLLVPDIMLQHLQKIHDFRLLPYQCQHNDTESILQLSMLIQLIQNHVGIGILPQFNYHPDTFSVGLVTNIRNTVNFFQLHQFCYFYDQICLVYHVGKFRGNDLTLPIGQILNIGHSSDDHFAPACSVSF